MNNMFKQWQISKQIQKDKLLYEKNNAQQNIQLQKYIKKIISNPEMLERRINQLLEVPALIRKSKIKLGYELIVKSLGEYFKI